MLRYCNQALDRIVKYPDGTYQLCYSYLCIKQNCFLRGGKSAEIVLNLSSESIITPKIKYYKNNTFGFMIQMCCCFMIAR